MTRRAFLLSAVVLLFSSVIPTASAADGRILYVSTSGTDGEAGRCDGGTQPGSAWRTIEYGMRCVQPGDTLMVMGGVYNERVTPFQPDGLGGTANAPILVTAEPGSRPVIRGLMRLDRPDHWTIRGLTVTADDGSYGKGEYLVKLRGGIGWSFENNRVWGARSFAAVRVEQTSGSDPAPSDWRITGNCIHDTSETHGSGQDHNLYVYTGPGGSGSIERNVVFGAPNGQNIKLGTGLGKGDERTENVRVVHNTLFGARQNVMVVGDSHNNVVERNLMGHVVGEDWYPNVRGYSLTGTENAAHSNAAFTGNSREEMIFVGNESPDHEPSTQTFAASGNLFPVTPQFDSDAACTGFYPTKKSYRGYGAYAPVDSGDPINRIAGVSREATSVEISEVSFPTSESAEAVVVARSDDYPDALAGGPLAAMFDAPILLTNGDRLGHAVANEIERLGADDAILLGGPAALSDQVRRDIEGLGLSARRIAGTNRFATAAAVGKELAGIAGTDVENAYVVEGVDEDPTRGWPDAVAVGSLAAQLGRPILLVTTDALPDDTRGALGDLNVEHATIVGGSASVSESVAKAIDDTGPSVGRIAGASRFETSHRIAESALEAGADPTHVWFATGGSFPDALAAGPAVAKDGGVLLLVPGSTTFLNEEATAWIDRFQDGIQNLELIGGPAAISHAIEDKSRFRLSPW